MISADLRFKPTSTVFHSSNCAWQNLILHVQEHLHILLNYVTQESNGGHWLNAGHFVMNCVVRLLIQSSSSPRLTGLKYIQFRKTSFHGFLRSSSIFGVHKFALKLIHPDRDVKFYNTGAKTRTKNFYKVLGVSPKATQAQIKNAFYKLSITHHPDKHKGSAESHEKFQNITEAYNVLGNQESRKQYDRELIGEGQLRAEHAQGYEHPQTVKKSGSIYNFDEWTKAHYSDTLDRNHRTKLRQEQLRKEKLNTPTTGSGTMKATFVSITVLLLICMYYYSKNAQKFESKDDFRMWYFTQISHTFLSLVENTKTFGNENLEANIKW